MPIMGILNALSAFKKYANISNKNPTFWHSKQFLAIILWKDQIISDKRGAKWKMEK